MEVSFELTGKDGESPPGSRLGTGEGDHPGAELHQEEEGPRDPYSSRSEESEEPSATSLRSQFRRWRPYAVPRTARAEGPAGDTRLELGNRLDDGWVCTTDPVIMELKKELYELKLELAKNQETNRWMNNKLRTFSLNNQENQQELRAIRKNMNWCIDHIKKLNTYAWEHMNKKK